MLRICVFAVVALPGGFSEMLPGTLSSRLNVGFDVSHLLRARATTAVCVRRTVGDVPALLLDASLLHDDIPTRFPAR